VGKDFESFATPTNGLKYYCAVDHTTMRMKIILPH